MIFWRHFALLFTWWLLCCCFMCTWVGRFLFGKLSGLLGFICSLLGLCFGLIWDWVEMRRGVRWRWVKIVKLDVSKAWSNWRKMMPLDLLKFMERCVFDSTVFFEFCSWWCGGWVRYEWYVLFEIKMFFLYIYLWNASLILGYLVSVVK